MRWRETEIRDIMLNPANIGIKVNPEDIFLLNVRGYYLLLGAKFSKEELTKEKFQDLYLKFIELVKEKGFAIDSFNPTFTDTWLETQLERVDYIRTFAQAINEMLNENK
ncbi:MAG: hypothetical protein ACOYJ1_07520 [Peptococcales bacterium]